MKKTIITLIALAGVAFASESITLGTSVGSGTGAAGGVIFTLKDNPTRYTLTGLEESQLLPNTLTLSSITLNDIYYLNARATNDSTYQLWLYVTDEDGHVLGISDKKMVSVYTTDANATGNTSDYTFDFKSLTISKNTEYKVWFKSSETAYTTDAVTGVKNIAETNAENIRTQNLVTGLTGSQDELGVILTNGTNGTGLGAYAYTMSASFVVPEPTTATLSLLALAGLAARRRRK